MDKLRVCELYLSKTVNQKKKKNYGTKIRNRLTDGSQISPDLCYVWGSGEKESWLGVGERKGGGQKEKRTILIAKWEVKC